LFCRVLLSFSFLTHPAPRSPLFPYTTLFRSLSAPNEESDVFATGSKSRKKDEVVFHSGTYNGHPIALAAGLETIHMLEEDGVMKDRKSTRLNSSHVSISYAVFCLKKKNKIAS